MKTAFVLGLAALACGLAAAPVQAQSADPYAACAATADDAARLACFDATYARENTARAERQQQERVRTAEEFGLSQAQLRERDEQSGAPVAAAAEEAVEGQTLTGVVADVFTNSGRKNVVLLTNGQLWAEQTNSTFRGTIKPEMKVEISTSWSGGYRMKFDGARGFLSVKRLR